MTKKQYAELLITLRRDIRNILGNKLSYPKVLISLSKQRRLTEAEWDKIRLYVDESIGLVDAKILEAIDCMGKPLHNK